MQATGDGFVAPRRLRFNSGSTMTTKKRGCGPVVWRGIIGGKGRCATSLVLHQFLTEGAWMYCGRFYWGCLDDAAG